MMLHFHHRKSQFFRDHHRIVLWMHITAYNLRFYFQQCFHPSYSLPKCFYRSQIFQISDIWRRIKSVIHTNAKVVKISEGTAVVDAGGAKREVSAQLLEDLEPGDYVMVHAGVAIAKITDEDDDETDQLMEELL